MNVAAKVRGLVNPKDYDLKFGRQWRKDKRGDDIPTLYSTIGQPNRPSWLRRTPTNLVMPSKGFNKIASDPYRKRWPEKEACSVSFFAEFCNKDPESRTLLETLHQLPNHGVGCSISPAAANVRGVNATALRVNSVTYRVRPIIGEINASLMCRNTGSIARSIRAPCLAKGWKVVAPLDASPRVFRPTFPSCKPSTDP